ncbi:NfeD family protein [Leptolyngbya sp. FACHB-711]|uniref:NfeD family protein n=1 Tax=unclassified Leptolyngbya TaxID=2650499 RepID=UPI001682D53F|nr:NfeD family protein [Leptolyngbya sp. FACHB-711]MBD1850515.1 NfeD family protein [Cyanobacteria bacterium FACHB-502]MBD2027320.1 NfeD family protein [Leptolyngbya sp. FACHB-711]
MSLPPSTLWLFVGFLCLMAGTLAGEPSAAAIGIAALITGIAALSLASATVQVILWGILSIALIVVLRGMVPKASIDLSPAQEATVTETIPPSGIGLVSYEGALWRARCQISDISIAPGQMVYVVGRQGLTLMVLPTTFLEEIEDFSNRPRIKS